MLLALLLYRIKHKESRHTWVAGSVSSNEGLPAQTQAGALAKDG